MMPCRWEPWIFHTYYTRDNQRISLLSSFTPAKPMPAVGLIADQRRQWEQTSHLRVVGLYCAT